MKIAFVTTMSAQGSTIIGRVIPLATELSKRKARILLLGQAPKGGHNIAYHSVGQEPFRRTASGKNRTTSIGLILNMLSISISTAVTLTKQKPDVVVIVKSLPHNTLGVWLYQAVGKITGHRSRIILDVDDFELTANVLTSLWQRASIHWAERAGAKMASVITAATPFLVDHFQQLTNNTKRVIMIPTGINPPHTTLSSETQANLKSDMGRSNDTASGGGAGVPRRAPAAPPLGGVKRSGGGAAPTGPEAVSKVPTILYIGSVSISSGHRVDILPDILKQVRVSYPAAQLLIAGDGDDVDTLKNKFAGANLTNAVTWHGRFTEPDVPALIAQTSIIIDPIDNTISNRAKSSYRCMLAGAYGKPIVTNDIGIRPYLIPPALHDKFFTTGNQTSDYAKLIVDLIRTPLTSSDSGAMQLHNQSYHWPKLAQEFSKQLS